MDGPWSESGRESFWVSLPHQDTKKKKVTEPRDVGWPKMWKFQDGGTAALSEERSLQDRMFVRGQLVLLPQQLDDVLSVGPLKGRYCRYR